MTFALDFSKLNKIKYAMTVVTLVLGLLLSALDPTAASSEQTETGQMMENQETSDYIICEDTGM